MAYGTALALLADPTRRRIFERVAEQPRSVGDIAAGLPVSRPAVSQHLKALRDAGLISSHREGTRHIYAARPEALGELREYVEGIWRDVLQSYAARGKSGA